MTVRRRLFWLVVNLGTAIIAASVVSLFQAEIGKYAVLAVLMPIVAGMGGNAGTQTLAVACRALATNHRTESNTLRAFARELKIALANGLALGLLIGTGAAVIFHYPLLGLVMGTAMIITNLAAGLGGILVPVTLDRFRVDPAVSSAVFVTTITDVTGFFSFLGLAALFLVPQICGCLHLHLSKVSFACRDLDMLQKRVAARAVDGVIRVPTRMRPKRAPELIGGKLYWIVHSQPLRRRE